MIAAGND